MRVAIGAILGVMGGPATYARELIRALAATQPGIEIVALTDAPAALANSGGNVRVMHAPLPGSFAQPAWDHLIVPYLVRRCQPDLYHATKGILPYRLSCPQVVTIHDLAVYRYPESFAVLQRWHQRAELPRTIRRAARIIADSEHARADIIAQFRLPPERVTAIALGVTPAFSPQPAAHERDVARSLGLPARFVLYAGTIQPRKNVEALVDAFAGWRGPPDWELVIAGRLRPGYRPAFIDGPPPRVRYLGAVSDAELAALYRSAIALISPSAYEGFGLSLLEAMACGCPVVAGGNSAAAEVLGGAGVLLEDLDERSIRSALDLLAADEHRRGDLRARGLARSAEFGWERTARATAEIYRTVMGRGLHD